MHLSSTRTPFSSYDWTREGLLLFLVVAAAVAQLITNGWCYLLRAADKYAYRLWKHCLFCRDRKKGHLYTPGVRPALLATPGRFPDDHPVDHTQLARLTPERGLCATLPMDWPKDLSNCGSPREGE
jgi:hypothetical protein